MRKFLLASIFFFPSYLLLGQDIYWADQVIEVSTELSPLQYSAQQALGKPDVPLTGGDNPNAWSPRRNDRTDFIKLGFDTPARIQQIAIHESLTPGSVHQVFTYDGRGNEYIMFTLEPKPIPLTARMLNIFFPMTEHEVHAIKVVIDGKAVPGENSIDAIGMSDSNIPISVTIQIAANVNMDLQTERLSENVNSRYTEHSPLLSPDGKTLFFSRANHPDNIGGIDDYEDIWFSEWDDEKQEWKEAKNLGSALNTKGPNFISSVSEDGNNLVLLLGNQYTKNGKMRAGVSISSKQEDGTWSEPQAIEIANDYNYSPKSDYYMANDLKTLVMSIERDDTHGYRDIYVSFDQGDGKWSEPMNLGNTINTAADEAAPFLAEDSETLYFSTSGYAGYGGNDIYVSKRLDDSWTNWTEPENMGSGVNSENNDNYFNIPKVGDYGYLSKEVEEDNADIFRFQKDELYAQPAPTAPPKVIVKGVVRDSKTGLPLAAVVIVERLPDGTEVARVNSDPKTGAYQFELEYGSRYGYRAEVEGFIPVNQNLDLNALGEDKTISADLMMTPIEVAAVIVLNNIFFDFDRSELKTSSTPELDRVVGYFKEGQLKSIKVSGHTCDIGTEQYNMGLSQRRAQAVGRYLVSKGVQSGKVEVKWYGESQPSVPNTSTENQVKNRRVEFEILE